ncbi:MULTISPECIES: cyclopropane-fatty-acyl-phospholipid synthase family protein [unclassified Mesorhizobium]|uniref:SAM-dependent methyltransferase n=1 Tax=unclassified Mesorhizobium TaxID=325217 RepID=UPI00112AAE73|nr:MULTISPECIES: cyclopropane-fatty-acyl-phospholipid synthase family protein [unclassified Mesorhizobium]TPK64869.1 class I SAM-dependent methyltransferase [Mesorhizobium sp. B2-5-1]TPM67048.1 class I SAM-dependent methyltransferase [Mesorhizobium sp. B2-1-9]TPM82687.1 class I SAM-dependent methyltransferase [Mesorhizobium sp. B2-1-4]TPN06880.1 class I SAM-dependent methyltransferase [Mesorhizobium sp. B2-1-2]UCI14278.1 cyclopropane-fatty-acyl-phospholipid synthase family protein [Mesorhizobi
MDATERAARIVRTVVQALKPGFAVRLWTGERIGPAGGPVLAINDQDIVWQLARRPNFSTLVEMWISKAVDVEEGSLFDLYALPSQGKLRFKALPKLAIMRDLPAVLFSRRQMTQRADLAGQNPFVSGSNKQAIQHHYDISNAFYRLFLDERMVYSCGYFKDFANDIDQAQADKLEHICRKLRLKPGDRLLDIGCGWGAMLIHAVKHHGVVGHGVSLSEAQTGLARERIRAEGLEDRITVEIKSYAELTGSFDKISSIGMFEHLGLANHAAYFSTVHRLLKPGGVYLHHAITRRSKGSMKKTLRKGSEYKALIKYIFPGGEIDTIGMTCGNLEAHGFLVHDVENLREHYARTCRLWAERLHARFDEAIAEVGEAKARLWLLYLAGCSIAFDRASAQIFQTVATKRTRGPSGLPPTRADLYR